MSDNPAESEARAWHKRVAIDCNNRAWDLSTQTRTAAEDLEMLTAAHVSAYHWAVVGTELNRMRATMLLAEVHALLGHGETAMRLADEMRAYFVTRDDTPDWELAFTHVIHAHCAQTAGKTELHRRSYDQAVKAIAAIAADEERKIVEQTFRNVAAP